MSDKIYTLKLSSSCKCQGFLELTGTKKEITERLLKTQGFKFKCSCRKQTQHSIKINKSNEHHYFPIDIASIREEDNDKIFIEVQGKKCKTPHYITVNVDMLSRDIYYRNWQNWNVLFRGLNNDIINYLVKEVKRLFSLEIISSFLDEDVKDEKDLDELNNLFKSNGFVSEIDKTGKPRIRVSIVPSIAIYFVFRSHKKHKEKFVLMSFWGHFEEITYFQC